MKKFYLITILSITFCFQHYLVGQTKVFYTAGGNDVDESMAVCTDPSGDIITAGYFTNTCGFDSYNLTSTSVGVPDIFVNKVSSTGFLYWAVKAGGLGSDRALSVKTDQAGNIYITGFITGTAQFGNIQVTSVNNSQDFFIAKLDYFGNFQWVKTGTGNLASWGNSITISPQGNIIVTGQFQGTMNLSGNVITSLTNPLNGIPSFDVFTAQFDASGNLKWLKTGKSKFDNRGLDVASDAQGNVYVCGQFSDTIQFQNTHANAIKNAVFLIKYDSTGQEMWFRKASGTFAIAYGLAVNSNGEVYVCGDFTGNLAIHTTGISFLNSSYLNKIFILKFSSSGTLIWSKTEGSNSPVSCRKISLDPNEDPYIVGEFKCTFNEYSNVYGTGIFNSIGFQDLFVTKFNQNGNRQWVRHFGGPGNDKAHGIAVPAVNLPVICGSFFKNLTIPASSGFYTPINLAQASGNPPIQPTTYCSDNEYNRYVISGSRGYCDLFLICGIDLSREPYDYYERSGTGCLRDRLGVCIEGTYTFNSSCPDTIKICQGRRIFSNSKTGSEGFIGPKHHYRWNNSPNDTLYYYMPITTGNVTLQSSTEDGCYTSFDTVFVIMGANPLPPTITDELGINLQSPPNAINVSVCGPDTLTLTAGNLSGDSVHWYGPYLSASDSSINVCTTGYYYAIKTNQMGCTDTNRIYVQIDRPLLPFIPFSTTDSLEFCANDYGVFQVFDSITNPTAIPNLACVDYTGIFVIYQSPGLTIQPSQIMCNPSLNLYATQTGMHHFKIGYLQNNACGSNTVYLEDSVFIKVNPLPVVSISINGAQSLCPGSVITLSCTATWGPAPNVVGQITNGSNTLNVTTPGFYSFSVLAIDTTTGCTITYSSGVTIQPKLPPLLFTNPSNGLICPNDSVEIICNSPFGINYEWHGPTGIIPKTSSYIFESIPGFYHCVFKDSTGCDLTTNTIEIKQYNSPYLIGDPINIMCNNQPIDLHVISNDTTLISWQSPLSGTGTFQTVTSPGTYSCSVTMCNITTICSLQVTGSNPVASILVNGQTTLCPFDSVQLSGPPGMSNYFWTPTNQSTQTIYTHQSGMYSLTVMDQFGCTDTSIGIPITYTTNITPPIATGDSICPGSISTVNASCSSWQSINWYQNPNAGPLIGTGNIFQFGPILSTDTIYASIIDSTNCQSFGTPVIVFVKPGPGQIQASVNSPICMGYPIQFNTDSITNGIYFWSGPNNFSSGIQNPVIFVSDTTMNGAYSVYVSVNGCNSQPAQVLVNVIPKINPICISPDTVCEGSNANLIVQNPTPQTNYFWSGPNGFLGSSTSIVINNIQINQGGNYYVYGNNSGCLTNSTPLQLYVFPAPVIQTVNSGGPYCDGDTIKFTSLTLNTTEVNWIGPNGSFSISNDTILFPASALDNGNYYLIATNQHCTTQSNQMNITVNALPQISLPSDTTICSGSTYTLSVQGTFTSLQWNFGSTSQTIFIDTAGNYVLTAINNNCQIKDSIFVSVKECYNFGTNIFTPNGDGINDVFYFEKDGQKPIECEIFDRWGNTVWKLKTTGDGWAGDNIQHGKACDEGTYFFVAKYKDEKNKITKMEKGNITLQR